MINNIIFSKNRALQLRLLLESVKRNAPGIFNISIIYTSTNEDFDKGYEILKSENVLDNINWVKQTDNFKEDVLKLLDSEYEFSCFATDDDIVYGKIESEDKITQHFSDKNLFCFSLRLGKNTTYCYSMDCDNVLIPTFEDDEFVKWNWHPHYSDNGYSLSLDYNIFRTIDILKLIKKISFSNPNTLEGNLQIFNNYPKEFMVAFKHSVVVNSPTNIVNTVYANRNGEKFGITAEDLNKKYLEGEVIDYDAISFEGIKSCHQELNFSFKDRVNIIK